MRVPLDTVLLVIDVQQAIEHPCWGARNNPGADDRIAALVGAWRECSMPIVHVRHDSTEPESPYRPGQALHAFKPCAAPLAGEMVFGKRTGSAFVQTGLDEHLTAGGHTTLVVCGVLTHNSVETSVRHAGCLGYRVFVAGDACQAADLADAAGRVWPAEDVHQLALAKLALDYASVVSSDAAILAAHAIAARSRAGRGRDAE
jgi:nicotinamidase-related amidase